MMGVGNWFERKFTFDVPIHLFPEMVERLRGTPSRLEEKAIGLSAEALTKRDNGTWSIQENMGHLLDLEFLHTSRLQEFIRGVKVLTAADLKNQKTHTANHNSQSLDSILKTFRSERSHFISIVEQMDEQVIARTALHPRLQKMMNVLDLCYFMAEHDDHHLARISELTHLWSTSPTAESLTSR
ncbi:MAG: DinB family protein [Bacteroidetes bacterium]|nr:DinB family protein [Bacteroidota bacterium]